MSRIGARLSAHSNRLGSNHCRVPESGNTQVGLEGLYMVSLDQGNWAAGLGHERDIFLIIGYLCRVLDPAPGPSDREL